MKRLALALTLCLSPASSSPAGPAGRSDPETVLRSMQQASGSGWGSIRSLHLVATIKAEGRTGTSERWEDVRAGRTLRCQTWPGYTVCSGFDGITPWHLGRSGIAYALGDVDSALGAADDSFRAARAWWFPERHPATIAALAPRSEGGRGFDVLEVTPQGGRMFQAWIDQVTHLPDRMIEQEAEEAKVVTYADYRTVQGVRLPFTIRTGDGIDPAYDEVETVQRVGIDEPVPDSLYALPPRPASDTSLPAGRTSVEVPFRLTADDRILVPLTLNGQRTVEAEFDSGGNLLIQPATVSALGLAEEGAGKARGGGEEATLTRLGRLDSIGIGGVVIHQASFHSLLVAPDTPERALVGLEVLQRFVVGLDFDRDVMTLTRPETFVDHGKGVSVPFHIQDNQPEVHGSVDGIAGLFAIDTGDAGSLLLIAPFARRYDLVARYHADIPYQGQSVGVTNGVWARLRANMVTFDGADGRPVASVHAPVTRISLQHSGFDASRTVSANIGLGILKQFNLTFDYTRQVLTMEPNHLYGQKDVFNRAGLRVKRVGDGWTVAAVYPDSPAGQLGLRVGDPIRRIDGETPATLDPDGLWRKLLAPVGTQLQLDAGAPERHVVLTLRDLL